MSFKCKFVKVEAGKNAKQVIGQMNNPALAGGVIDDLLDIYNQVNSEAEVSDNVYIPILPRFYRRHPVLVDYDDVPKKVIEPEVEFEPETGSEYVEVPDSNIRPRVDQQQAIKDRLKNRPIYKNDKLHYRLYPYTFARPNETIEAVVRLYNDMKVSPQVIAKLVHEFTKANLDSLPPKLGQTVQIPVLLPFCFRHENENKIFTDE